MVSKKRVFISYGREQSLDFANRLYLALEKKGIDAWFDFANIPKGDDFQKRIDDGIENADNFIFVMSPHALKSSYCQKELKTAVKYHKRIIPISHVEIADGNSIWGPLHKATIKKLNWIQFRETEDKEKPQAQWESIDDFDKSFKELLQVLNRDAAYISTHTGILSAALLWDRKRRMQHHLLAGPDLFEASEWLSVEFAAPAQPPCLPTSLQCEFICESIKNANNLMADVFMISSSWSNPFRDFIRLVLARNKITTWRYATDIQVGMEEADLIKEGIEGADNVLFLISKESIKSKKCLNELALAIGYNKRIIPISVEDIGTKDSLPEELKNLSDIDFTSLGLGGELDPMNMQQHKQVNMLVNEIEHDHDYFHRHKQLLTRALKWKRLDKNDSFLIRGYNLTEAQTWLQEGLTRNKYQPNNFHQEFLQASEAKVGVLQSEVFISYSQKNADFARKLNLKLQTFGKNTWFDQESLVGASNFEEEIFKGIASSENFVFIISPESVASDFCAKEVAYAAEQSKRFIPILLEETPIENIPATLRNIQWVDFQNKTFETAFGRLIQAINIDRVYVKQHTRLLQSAIEWEGKGKSIDMLIRGEELDDAEEWLDNALENKREPVVTVLQREYIEASEALRIEEEKKELKNRNLRRILRIAAFATLAAIIIVLGYQFRLSKLRELEASEKAALNYAYAAREILNNEHAPERALSVIKEAVNIVNEESAHKLLPYFRDISMSLNYTEMDHTAPVKGVDLSKDVRNRQLLSFTVNEVRIWDLGGELLYSLPRNNITEAGFSPDYEHIYIITENKKIELVKLSAIEESKLAGNFLNVTSKARIRSKELKANDQIVDYKFFGRGDKIMVVYKSIAARVWGSNGGWLGTYNHNGTGINGGVISTDENYLLTYSNDNTARLWDLREAQGRHYISTLRQHNAAVISADLSSDSQKAVTLDTDGNANIWNLSNERSPKLIKSYTGIKQIYFTSDPNLILVQKTDQKVELQEIEGGFFSELMTYKQFSTGVDSVILAKDRNQILTYARNGSAALWKLNGQLIFEVDMFEDGSPVDLISLSPEGLYLLKSDKDGGITLWSTETGNELASLKAYKEQIRDVVFFPDHKQLVAASNDRTAKRWRFKDNLFEDMIASNASGSSSLKRNINFWLDSLNADSLKMAAKDKIRIGLMDDFSKIVNSSDSLELYTYAYYFKKEAESARDTIVKQENYEKALQLFENINDTLPYRSIDSEMAAADILFEQNEIDKVSFNTFFTPEGLEEYLYLTQYITQKWSSLAPSDRIEAYSYTDNLYDIIRDWLANNVFEVSKEREINIMRRASDNCNSLAYYYLLEGNLDETIKYAEKGIEIDSSYEWIITKLALAHLYNGAFDQAIPLLKKMQGNKFGVDEYDKAMRNYVITIDAAYTEKRGEKALPMTLREVIEVHQQQINVDQIKILELLEPQQ